MTFLLFPFQFGCLLFIYLFIHSFIFVWLLWLGLPILCQIVVVRTGILVLFLKAMAFSFSPLKNDITWGFVLNDLSCVDMFSYYTSFVEGFLYHEWMLGFVKCFFCVCWDNYVIFILSFVNVVYHINLWVLYPWNKSLNHAAGFFLYIVEFDL